MNFPSSSQRSTENPKKNQVNVDLFSQFEEQPFNRQKMSEGKKEDYFNSLDKISFQTKPISSFNECDLLEFNPTPTKPFDFEIFESNSNAFPTNTVGQNYMNTGLLIENNNKNLIPANNQLIIPNQNYQSNSPQKKSSEDPQQQSNSDKLKQFIHKEVSKSIYIFIFNFRF